MTKVWSVPKKAEKNLPTERILEKYFGINMLISKITWMSIPF